MVVGGGGGVSGASINVFYSYMSQSYMYESSIPDSFMQYSYMYESCISEAHQSHARQSVIVIVIVVAATVVANNGRLW